MDDEHELSHSWSEYRRLILTELQSLNDNLTRLTDKIDVVHSNLVGELNKVDKRVVVLETKAGILGALGGFVSVCVVELIKHYVGGS